MATKQSACVCCVIGGLGRTHTRGALSDLISTAISNGLRANTTCICTNWTLSAVTGARHGRLEVN